MMATLERGHFRLHSTVKPPVTAGKYQLMSEQIGTPFDVAPEATHITVTSPRYVMPPGQILSSFPPANGEGSYGDRLPQIVLQRRTLPWERNPEGEADPPDIPWLALVVVAENEAQLSSPTAVAECVTPGVQLPDPDDRDVDKGVYLAVTKTVLEKVFPTKEDLSLLVHVREVDVQDTELAGGDDDGWLAVVLANRLPVYDHEANKPVRYLACLVNLEGQIDALPDPPPSVDQFVFALAQDWSKIDSRLLDPDLFSTGGGIEGVPSVGGGANVVAGGGGGNPAPGNGDPAPGGGNPAPAPGTYALPDIGANLDGATVTRAMSASEAWATSPTRAIAEAAADPDAPRLVRDTMGIRFRIPIDHIAVEKVYRFPVLAHWSFTTRGKETFEKLMHDLDVGLLGTKMERKTKRDESEEQPQRPLPPPPPPPPTEPTTVQTGHIRLDHNTRRGDATTAWYRGPFVPHPTDRDQTGNGSGLVVAHAADQLRHVVPDGMEDLGLAAAFEIGRLLALSQLSIVSALLRFRKDQFGASRLKNILKELVPQALQPALDPAFDLGNLVTNRLVGRMAENPAKVVGLSRPIADPGLPLNLSQGLDATVAEGLGLDLAAVRSASEQVGVVAALADIQVPSADPGAGAATPSHLHDALHKEVARLTSLALPDLEGLAGDAIPEVDPAAPGRDALGELIERARREED